MSQEINLPDHLTGLTDEEVIRSREMHGLNTQKLQNTVTWWKIVFDILREPMLIILFLVSALYFLLGQYGEAWFMVGAIIIVSGISFYQDNRSRLALEALEALNTPVSRVVRNALSIKIPTTEIVPGDLVIAEEGSLINADGHVVYSHDLSVNESTLTGEAFPVVKSERQDSKLYSGTMVSSGIAVYRVTDTGQHTRLGQLGTSLTGIKDEASPLQKQIRSFVQKMAIAGVLVFMLVWLVSYLEHRDFLLSLMKGLTLAMSVLPEEIPVAFTTFMALGSRRLIRDGVLVKKTRTVETLGNATVICTDKTGTITENRMQLQGIYTHADQRYSSREDPASPALTDLLEAAMWASEPIPFDPMEKAIHEAYGRNTSADKRKSFRMVHEYPLGGIPPMMTHVFEDAQGTRIIAAKGAPEALLQVSGVSLEERLNIEKMVNQLAEKGYRILGVGVCETIPEKFPARQQDIVFTFAGLLAFLDPAKKDIASVFQQFNDAGIVVKIITGDNAVTTQAIAREAGLVTHNAPIDGDELMKMDDTDLQTTVRERQIFTRMFPEAKLKTVNTLRSQDEIVAMIGDGVNDGPALKAADIGIAMGLKGTELAKNAADLILLDDDISRMIDAIASGRRIYANLKKAVQYIVSIHIPIILTVSLPIFLGWTYPDIFTPVHVIFLELIMGPTCSIVYESEPLEKHAMQQPPRPQGYSFIKLSEMGLSVIQGLIISAGTLFMYHYYIAQEATESQTRTVVFITLILANIFLTLANRSFYYSVFESLKNKNALIWGVIGITTFVLVMMLYVPAIREFFKMSIIPFTDFIKCLMVAFASVFWIEVWKLIQRKKNIVKKETQVS